MNALFIGNSFTARNDLPDLIGRMVTARGMTFRHRLITRGDASLRTHWNAGEAVRAIRRGRYDHVVLQEQSTLPVKNAGRMHENVRLFDEVIKEAGAKTVLYMTWARKNAPESQAAITDAYNAIGRKRGATVVPVGAAGQRFLNRHDLPVLSTGTGTCRIMSLDKLSMLDMLSIMDNGTLKLGSYLRSARSQRSLSLRAVERATGISNAYLSQIESGKIREPSPTMLHKLAELYNVPYADLMALAGYPDSGSSPTKKRADTRLGPMTTSEEKAVREYLEFLRSKRG